MAILFCFGIFLLRFIGTSLVRASTIITLFKKARLAALLDFADEALSLLVLYVLFVDKFYFPYALSAVTGSAIATFCVSKRWPKWIWKILMKGKKRISHKKQEFTNA